VTQSLLLGAETDSVITQQYFVYSYHLSAIDANCYVRCWPNADARKVICAARHYRAIITNPASLSRPPFYTDEQHSDRHIVVD
jgi:hypothetical protein